MRTVIAVPVWVLICFAVGLLASYFQNDALTMWYPMLRRSSITPPNIVFPIVWSILYLLMGISAGIVQGSGNETRRLVLTVFIVQLILNFLWCITFFTMRNPLLGLWDILLLDAMVLLYIVLSYRVNRVASFLFIPYIVWLMIATYLNAYIYVHN
jgi:tryptophan-rich sensory protein